MDNDTNSQRDIRLPAKLLEAAERLIQGTRFKSAEEFLSFVLQELTSVDSAPSDERERKLIEERLRDLGYL
ncbi:MAG: hypothetical protein HY010_07055 [Acidobacteria bacterium]|nr:hypothetical protein [Acidobacteriota bacterium]